VSYDDIAAAYLTPLAEPILPPAVPATPARRLRDALEPIATQGWWSRASSDRLVALGLGFFDGYVWGRAASLGTPAPAVVVATFGVFEPGLLTAVYGQGVAAAARDDVLAARTAGAAESLAALVSEQEAAAVADPLLAAVAGIEGAGRPLFSALRDLPVPDTAAGRLWRAAELVREHRGDGHLAAAAVAGFDAATLNVFTELWLGYPFGEYSGTRGFGADRLGAALAGLERRGWVAGTSLTPEGRAARLELEAATDASQAALVDAVGDRIEGVIGAAEAVAVRVLVAGAFPSDPRKRAGG
jgi:Helix-turn-helix family